MPRFIHGIGFVGVIASLLHVRNPDAEREDAEDVLKRTVKPELRSKAFRVGEWKPFRWCVKDAEDKG
jgi:hypothetical protein